MNRTLISDQDAQDYRDGYEHGYKEKMAALAKESAGQEKQAEASRSLLARLLIDIINGILALLGFRTRIMGGSWRPASAKQVAQAAVASESVKAAVDEPREVLRVARRIQLGATVDQARLSEPVLGALLVMSKPELADIIKSDMDTIGTWVAVQRGVAPKQDDHDRAVARQHEAMWAGARETADDRNVGAPSYAR